MSVYANYSDISKSYDKTRKAIGVEVILGYIELLKTKKKGPVTLLDIGCGTGNYEAIIAPYVDKICCIDINQDMLNIAQEKLQPYKNKIEFINSNILDTTLKEESFDIVICNQSLHHLEKGNDNLFSGHKNVISKISKSLVKGGIFIINTISHKQLRDGVWWGDFILPAINKMEKKFISEHMLLDLLNDNKLTFVDKIIPFNTIIQEDGYYNISSPLSAEFRMGDSHFSLLSEEDLNYMVKEISILLDNTNKTNEFMNTKEILRLKTGQFSFYIARK